MQRLRPLLPVAPWLLSVLVACGSPAADDPAGGDSAGASLSWDPAPPAQVGTKVTFEADCDLLAAPQTMRWTLLEEGWWELDPEGTELGLRVEWLPHECRGNVTHPTRLWWTQEGAITYADVHRATPDVLPGNWLGHAAVGELPLEPACRELLESHDALAPVLSLHLEEILAP